MADLRPEPRESEAGAHPKSAAGGPGWREIVDEPGTRLIVTTAAASEDDWAGDVASLLLIASSFRAARRTRPEAALPYLDAADALIDRGDVEQVLAVVSIILRSIVDRSLGRLQMSSDRLAQAARLLRGDGFGIHDRIALTALIEVHRGICELLQGACERARRSLSAAVQLAGDQLPETVRIEAHGCLAIVELLSGSIANADSQVALSTEIDPALARTGVCGIPARLARQALAVERGQWAALGDDVRELAEDAAHTEYEPLVMHTWSTINREARDVEATSDMLQQMQLVIRDWTGTSLAHTLHDLGSTDVLMRRQQTAAAREVLDALRGDSSHALCLPTVRSRIELERGNHEGAANFVEGCVALGDKHAPRTFCYALAVSSAAHVALGDNATADDRFTQLLGLLAINGFRRPATWLPLALLERLLERARDLELSERAEAVRDELVELLPHAESSDIRPLSGRERVILRLLVRGSSHAQIASELRVSPNTVKSQVRSLYAKLGVESRSGAVQRARALGLTEE